MVCRPRFFVVDLLVIAGCCAALLRGILPLAVRLHRLAARSCRSPVRRPLLCGMRLPGASTSSGGLPSILVGDFGFLVPTPSRPTLTEVDQQAFSHLARVTRRGLNMSNGRCRRQLGCGCSVKDGRSAGVNSCASPNAVRVLQETQIAGQDIAVLEADDCAVPRNMAQRASVRVLSQARRMGAALSRKEMGDYRLQICPLGNRGRTEHGTRIERHLHDLPNRSALLSLS